MTKLSFFNVICVFLILRVECKSFYELNFFGPISASNFTLNVFVFAPKEDEPKEKKYFVDRSEKKFLGFEKVFLIASDCVKVSSYHSRDSDVSKCNRKSNGIISSPTTEQ